MNHQHDPGPTGNDFLTILVAICFWALLAAGIAKVFS